jgi:large conductance mechanosensitive channel
MGMMKEFKEFALKGNVIDLAVGIVIGAAFSGIVSSIVGDVIMPIFGIILHGVNFAELSVTVGAAKITYGKFIQAVINFLIIAFSLFLVIKGINATKKKEAVAAPEPTNQEKLLTEIRDLLKK